MDSTNAARLFHFGKNWESFNRGMSDEKIAQAMKGIEKLIPAKELKGKSFLDVGCGSGLSMLAALRLGVEEVKGVDLDQDSVNAAQGLLSRYASGERWSVSKGNVLDLEPASFGSFDVVYSWGVLHHAGDMMWEAIRKCGALTKSNGMFVIALYHKTPLCSFWRREKEFYSQAGSLTQRSIRFLYKTAKITSFLVNGKNPVRHLCGDNRPRGMDWHHDVHDWLGGFPYASTFPGEVIPQLQNDGFAIENVFENCAGASGLLGTGCDEYVCRRLR